MGKTDEAVVEQNNRGEEKREYIIFFKDFK